MSWIDRIQTDLIITCGDGKNYTPSWVNASKGIEYNVGYFNFIGVGGTLVKRNLPKGTRYAIEIIFQGEDVLDIAEAFQTSAADPSPWTIQHPLYGSLLVQPSDLTFDDAALNTCRITGMLNETISENTVTVVSVSAPDKINADKDVCDNLLAETCANDIPNIGAKENASLLSATKSIYSSVSKRIKSSADAAEFFNAYNKVNGIINSGFYSTMDTLGAIHDYLSLPYKFADTLTNRLQMFTDQFTLLGQTLSGLVTQQSKKLYEHNAGVSVSSIIQTTITNIESEYRNVDDVFNVISQVLSVYNSYMQTLDSVQTSNGGDQDSYIPDADALTSLSQLMFYAMGALADISSGAKQKRTYFLAEDSNVILIAKKLYGLSPDDSEITTLIDSNNIGLNEILGLKKGRKIIYYV